MHLVSNISLASLLLLFSHGVLGQTYDWVLKIGDSGNDYPQSLAVDSLGNTFVIGSFLGIISLGNDTITTSNLMNTEMFLAKIGSSGNPISLRKLEDNWERIEESSLTPLGHLTLVGTTYGLGGAGFPFIAQYDTATGAKRWDQVGASNGYSTGLSINDHGTIWTTYSLFGGFGGLAQMNDGGDVAFDLTFTSATGEAGFLDVITDEESNAYVLGNFEGQITLTGQVATNSFTIDATNGLLDTDIFLAKI